MKTPVRIVIDVQAIQSRASANRDLGHNARSLIDAMLREAPDDEFILLMNGMVGDENDRFQREFTRNRPNVRVRVWTAVPPAGHQGPADRRRAAEAIREAVIADLSPDVVLLTSLFEGLNEDVVTTVGRFSTAILLHDHSPLLFPLAYMSDWTYESWYHEKLEALKRADLLLAISETAARDAVTHLRVEQERVRHIGPQTDAPIAPHPADEATQEHPAGGTNLVPNDDDFLGSPRDSVPAPDTPVNWKESARITIAALRELAVPASPAVPAAPAGKPRLAYVSPMPPERSGISRYSADLLPELAEFYDIELVLGQDSHSDTVARHRLPVRRVQWLRERPLEYDRVLYQMGSSHLHSHMFDLLPEIPGTVVLHDFFLAGVEARRDPVMFTRVLAEQHGYHAALERFDPAGDGLARAIRSWPANGHVLRAAEGVIVHSEHARSLARHYYGAPAGEDWSVVPLLRAPSEPTREARALARSELGVAPDELLICSFGHHSANTPVAELLEAFLKSTTAAERKSRLVFVGDAGDEGGGLLLRVAGTPFEKRVHVTGWASDATYNLYLLAADLAVQPRRHSRGQTPGAVLDCLNFGLPAIVNAHGSMVELPGGTVLRIADDFTEQELAAAIDRLAGDPALRAWIGAIARQHVLDEHAPEKCARDYRDAIETFHHRYRARGRDLFSELARLPPDPARDRELAQAIADTFPAPLRPRQLMVDVTAITRHDRRTSQDRVTSAILFEWLRSPPPGWRVEPVRADAALGRYRYARRFTCEFLGIPADWADDRPADFAPGDHFIGIAAPNEAMDEMRAALSAMRTRGVTASLVVPNPMPLHAPDDLGEAEARRFEAWLQSIFRFDTLFCVSHTAADSLRTYARDRLQPGKPIPRIAWFHPGADFAHPIDSTTLPDDVERQLEELGIRPSFLMVGTIGPRKGHRLALDAFERFWAGGGDANLVIVGAEGPQADELGARLRDHVENGKRLFWLERIGDAHLQRLYASCDGLLAPGEGVGFGLPLVEASKHDLPILARDIPVHREVAGDRATYFDGRDPASLAQALEDWLNARRAGRIARSGRSRHPTWRESAISLLHNLGIEPTGAATDQKPESAAGHGSLDREDSETQPDRVESGLPETPDRPEDPGRADEGHDTAGAGEGAISSPKSSKTLRG